MRDASHDGELLSTYVGLVATAWDGSFGRDASLLHRGRDHDVLVVGREAVFRFPRHERARAALPREAAAIARLVEKLDDPQLPHVVADRADAPLGRAFVGQRFLDGEPLPRTSVDAVGPMAYRFAAELARVLDALADVDLTGDIGTTLENAPLRATFPDLAGAVRDTLYDRMSASGRARADRELDAVLALPPAQPALVHGDFTGSNLLWDADDTRLTGILDWAQVHVGDPAYDVASIAGTYGWDLAATVDAATDRDDPALLDRARAYAGTFALQTAYGALTAGDDEAADEALAEYRA